MASVDDASCAVTGACYLYTWGSGWGGRLGHGDTADQPAPKRAEALRDEWSVAVSLSRYPTIAATRGGGVLGRGMAEGLGMPHAATVVVPVLEDNDNAEARVCVMSPHRHPQPQLTCVPRTCEGAARRRWRWRGHQFSKTSFLSPVPVDIHTLRAFR